MSDVAIQGYIQTLIQANAAFSDADVSLGNFRSLDRGSPPYAVVLPGEIISGERAGDWAQVTLIWEHSVEVFHRFLDDSFADFCAARQTVVDIIGRNPTLGGNSEIIGAYVSAAPVLGYLYSSDGGDIPAFVIGYVTVRTVEQVSYAGVGEFA